MFIDITVDNVLYYFVKYEYVCLGADQGAPGRPTFTKEPTVRMFEESALIECQCTADPVPSSLWTVDGRPVTPGTKYKQGVATDGKIHRIFLEISQVSKKDSGLYKVTAKNAKGEGIANIQLNIEGIEFKLVEKPTTMNFI